MRKKLKIVSSIFQWFLTTVLVLVVLLLVFTAFNPVKSLQVLRVMSGSMEPKIKTGSVVFVQKVEPGSLKKNDIITYTSVEDPDMSITHRLVAIEEKEGKTIFKTKGDANNGEDMAEVSPSQVKGRVVFSLPFLGYLSVWIREPKGFGLLVVLPAVLIIFSEVLNIKKAIEEEVEKKYRNKGKNKDKKDKGKKGGKTKAVLLLFAFLSFSFAGFRIRSTNAYFSDTLVSSGNTFSAGCWIAPSVPVLVYPADNHIAGAGSTWDLDPYMDWQDSATSCPFPISITYQYKSYHDENLTQLAYQSTWLTDSQIPATGTPDGVYYWQVRSQDNFGNISNFSAAWKLTVDRNHPTSEIISVQDYSLTQTFTIDYDSSDDTDFVQPCYSFNLGDWICDPAYVSYPDSPGTFSFDSPQGDGLYEFYTIATDYAGNVEYDTGKADDPYSVQVDSETPYTVLSLGEFGNDDVVGNRFAVNEQMVNGNFEDMNDPERNWVWGGDGEHRAVDDIDLAGEAEVRAGDNSGLIGWFDDDPVGDGQDCVYQVISLPSDPLTLSFWYQVISGDTIDYDWFEAKIVDDGGILTGETIIKTGSDEMDGWSGDSLWREITHSLASWVDQTIQVWFGVTNYDELGWPLRTFALIDDVRITNSDNFVTTDKEVELASNDVGSGVETTYYQVDGGGWQEYMLGFDLDSEGIGSGESVEVEYYSVDLAGNTEATRSLELATDDDKDYFGVVLNEFVANPIGDDDAPMLDGEWVELYNNSSIDIDVGSWVLYDNNDSHPLPITDLNTDTGDTIVSSESLLRVYLDGAYASGWLNNGGDQVRLYDGLIGFGGILIDSFTYPDSMEGKSWKRTPDGTGTWADPDLEEEKEIEVDIKPVGENKIVLSILNIPKNYGENGNLFEYEITYVDEDNIEKGIAGQILPEVVKSSRANQELYLGTCSAEGACIPDAIKDGAIYLTVVQGETTVIDNRQFKI